MSRPLHVIADEIAANWTGPKGVYFGAVPYLTAMHYLDTMQDRFGDDPASDIVRYFLSNATTWRGPVARAIKTELNLMLKEK